MMRRRFRRGASAVLSEKPVGPAGRQRLITWPDLRELKIDVIIAYMADRLTRSFVHFAKFVELFDKRSVSFVSVTQQLNTTTSLGRLTFNVPLSFAQFERETTSEHSRDNVRDRQNFCLRTITFCGARRR